MSSIVNLRTDGKYRIFWWVLF